LIDYPKKELGEYYMDVKLAGGNWQCDWGDGTCQAMEDEIDFAEKDDAEKSNEYKYVFDVGLVCLSESRRRADRRCRRMEMLGVQGSLG
jgi:hypothetical protein